MAAPLRVEVVGLNELTTKLNRLERNVFPAAAAKAINRTATTVRKEAQQELAKATGMPARAVGSRIKIVRRANKENLAAVVDGKGRPFNLVRFKARQLKKGVSANPWGVRRLFRSTFMVPAKAGSDSMFVAQRVNGTRKIRSLFGPGIAKEMSREAISNAREDLVRELLPKRLKAELDYRINRMQSRKR